MPYLQNVSKNETGLTTGERYTLFYVDEMMALTHRIELTLNDIREMASYAQYSNLLQVVFTQKGKRKPSGMLLKESMIFLKGWDLPLKVDTDFNSFAGNALLNFVGMPEEIRMILDNPEIDTYNFTRKGIIAYSLPDEQTTHNKKLLYPELAKNESHAVVQRMLGE